MTHIILALVLVFCAIGFMYNCRTYGAVRYTIEMLICLAIMYLILV